MFCKKCGKEINDGASYCNFCGANLTKTSYGNVFSKDMFNTLLLKINDFFAPLGKNKKLFISTIILLGLNPILATFDFVNISEKMTGMKIVSVGYSVFDFLTELAEDMVLLKPLMFIGILSIIMAEFIMLLPLFKKTEHQAKHFIATKIISVVAVIFIVFLYVISFAYGNDKELVEVGITFSGWLLLIESIALVIVSFKTSSALRKRKELE